MVHARNSDYLCFEHALTRRPRWQHTRWCALLDMCVSNGMPHTWLPAWPAGCCCRQLNCVASLFLHTTILERMRTSATVEKAEQSEPALRLSLFCILLSVCSGGMYVWYRRENLLRTFWTVWFVAGAASLPLRILLYYTAILYC